VSDGTRTRGRRDHNPNNVVRSGACAASYARLSASELVPVALIWTSRRTPVATCNPRRRRATTESSDNRHATSAQSRRGGPASMVGRDGRPSKESRRVSFACRPSNASGTAGSSALESRPKSSSSPARCASSTPRCRHCKYALPARPSASAAVPSGAQRTRAGNAATRSRHPARRGRRAPEGRSVTVRALDRADTRPRLGAPGEFLASSSGSSRSSWSGITRPALDVNRRSVPSEPRSRRFRGARSRPGTDPPPA
jgi:hypothetical protein